ncbi:cell surface hyaluronidase-like [Babylonia areolata]|uniref:cell surface hyaluronidase-like n=1 Tax=Babylonia areolata TaxID=304850 RepID=UPI003FD0E733
MTRILPTHELRITVKGQNLQAVDNFTYMGSTLSRALNTDAEVNNRITKASTAFGRLLYGELCHGKRSVGGQMKRHKDCLKASLKGLGVEINTWETLAVDRSAWHSKITTGTRASGASIWMMGCEGKWRGTWLWWLCMGIIGLGLVHVLHAECPHEPSSGAALRRWSDASQWPDGVKPSEGSAVVISDSVLLDESPAELSSVTVSAGGSLVFSPEGDVTLTTKYLMLYGALHIGSEDCPFPARAKILLTGKRGQYSVEGYGEKFVAVQRGATLELHGQRKLGWSRLTATVPAVRAGQGLVYSKMEDRDMANNVRGLVAFVLNGTTGERKFHKSVTLMGKSSRVNTDPPALLDALNEAEDGDVVVLAVQWNAIGDQVDMVPIYDAIERAAYGDVTNTSSVRQLREHDAWALVAVRGQFVKEDLGSRLRSDRRKEARVTAELAALDVVVSVVSNTKPDHDTAGYAEVLTATRDAGARVLSLAHDATTWRPGDKLLLTSTDYDWKQAEVAEVTYCSPNECSNTQVKVLLVNEYTHYGEITAGVDERGEVALLSRNIVIEGKMEDECPEENGNCQWYGQDTFGGHVTIEEGFGSVHIQGVELRHMGQLMESNRHPLFFRQCGVVDAAEGSNYTDPAYVRSTAIVNSYSKCVALSGTHGLLIEDNVAYDHYGSCFFLKEGGETRTVLDGNLGAGTRRIDHYVPLDKSATTFLITNPLTYFRNNVGAGGDRRGVWYLFPKEPVGESAGKGIMQPDEARHTAYTQFTNNAVHSYHEFGLRIDNNLNEQGDDSRGSNSYKPLVNPLDKDSADKATVLDRLHAYKNRYYNAWVRGGYFIVKDSSSSNQFQFLESSVFVGESDNTGEATQWWDADNRVWVTLPRAFPVPWDLRQPISGFTSMDGPNYLTNVRFHNFVPNENRTASALTFPGNSHWPSSPVNEVQQLSFTFDDGEDTGLRIFHGDSTDYKFGERDGDLQVSLRDGDGSLTGSAGASLVKNFPVYVTDQCYYRQDWKLSVCPHKYGKLDIHGNEGRGGRSRPILTRDDLSPSQSREIPNMHRARFPVILGGSHSYILHWSDFLPNPVSFFGLGFEKDLGVRLGMCVPRDAELELFSYSPEFRPRKDRWTQVSSIQALDRDHEGDRYFWDRENGIIFFKVINHRKRCADFKGECKDGCPFIRVTLLKGNASDSDCRDRISAYTRQPVSADGGLSYQPLPASASSDEELGAGAQVPFLTRPSVAGGYGQWSAWGPCTTTCGGGTQIRTRACDSPMPQHSGRQCEGPREETQVCGTTPCEVDGALSQWAEWSQCLSLPDNGAKGIQTRSRGCTDPAPLHNGIACAGTLEQVQGCVVTSVA